MANGGQGVTPQQNAILMRGGWPAFQQAQMPGAAIGPQTIGGLTFQPGGGTVAAQQGSPGGYAAFLDTLRRVQGAGFNPQGLQQPPATPQPQFAYSNIPGLGSPAAPPPAPASAAPAAQPNFIQGLVAQKGAK